MHGSSNRIEVDIYREGNHQLPVLFLYEGNAISDITHISVFYLVENLRVVPIAMHRPIIQNSQWLGHLTVGLYIII